MGVTLGPYELSEVLGRGGMGVVHRAVHRATGAVRAVKVLDGAPDAEAIERFRREAAALARAQGEGVVPVHDVGVAEGRLYFGMPLLEGGSLQQRLARSGPWAWREVVALGVTLARALERCHAVGLVHRDLKPANVLFDGVGRPHLADFGCVRDASAARLTRTGTLVGTPLYMAPELFGQGVADARADVYSLGAVLYELVAGHAPHEGAPIQVLSLAMAAQRPPLAGVPRAFEEVIAAALTPEPSRRLASAAALAARLEVLLGEPDLRPRGRSRGVVAGLAAAATIVGLAVASSSSEGPSPAPASGAASPSASAPPPPARDPGAEVRGALARCAGPDKREELREALEAALQEASPRADPSLAAAIVSATLPWRDADPVLASVVFSLAARLDPLVAQPDGLASRLALDALVELGTGAFDDAADVFVAQARLGHVTLLFEPRVSEVLARREERRGDWAERLALARALCFECEELSRAGRVAETIRLHRRGLELASVEESGLPRAAVALARFLQVDHERLLPDAPDPRLRLPALREFADDLSCPGEAFVLGFDIALQHRDLAAALPFIDGAGQYATGLEVRGPERPWAPQLTPYRDLPQLARLRVMSKLLAGTYVTDDLLQDLAGDKCAGLINRLKALGRPDLADKVRAALPR